ncbi:MULTISPECIES: TetR/AcrR family transcriptional regulator [Leptospira]|nr:MULTISPECIES: TetR/AcrR family transcriptional regulator [Leptospira]AVV50816.1 Transcriptional regulator, TetR family [Leptospira santarosai]EKO79266.1 transcriptional regulator, TetR family [Leptospira sp. Fiocruz LV3954]EKS09384.1 transcriptional regulator, TetR family [Leptospira santarosai str. JET]EKT85411.1 AcrR family transcriptional regulator [Leptospira santarosai serovar Shermani str. LT 821]EMI64198.1 transcriptional regulator, TetR family [Leptospira sp. Fiocruz LV4135]
MKAQSRKKKESGTGVRERILDTATSLFYKQGFSNTGMRQIIQESNSVAASLYDHYPSKKELGLAYLSRQEEKTLSDLQDLMDRYPDLGEFLRAWVILKEKQIRHGEFVGCPFAGFASQVMDSDPEYTEFLRDIVAKWTRMIGDYLQKVIGSGQLKRNMDIQYVARRILMAYHGSVTMWRMTGELRFIREMDHSLREIVEEYRVF